MRPDHGRKGWYCCSFHIRKVFLQLLHAETSRSFLPTGQIIITDDRLRLLAVGFPERPGHHLQRAPDAEPPSLGRYRRAEPQTDMTCAEQAYECRMEEKPVWDGILDRRAGQIKGKTSLVTKNEQTPASGVRLPEPPQENPHFSRKKRARNGTPGFPAPMSGVPHVSPVLRDVGTR